MIISRLTQLYDRLVADPEYRNSLPRRGTSVQKISFEVILDEQGRLIDVLDAKITKTLPPLKKGGKEKQVQSPREIVVCGSSHPSGSSPTPRFLWDTSAYIFGVFPNKAKKEDKDKQKAKDKYFPEYRDYHLRFRDIYHIQDVGFNAVCKFLEQWNPYEVPEDIIEKLEKYADNFGVFKILGHTNYVYESQEVLDAWDKSLENDSESNMGMALDSGEDNVSLARLVEPKIKLAGASAGGASLVSFNCESFESYGKSQSFNSPISQTGAFKACNALNFLLAWSRHHINVANTTIVFWTEVKTVSEDLFSWMIDSKDDAEGANEGEVTNGEGNGMDRTLLLRLKEFWKNVAEAKDSSEVIDQEDDLKTPFYIFGIEPNSARVVIRFWQESTLGEVWNKVLAHHRALQIDKRFAKEPDHFSVWQLLKETVRDSKDIPPLLPGALLRSIITGINYPTSLYQLVLNRVNVSHTDKDGRYLTGSKVTYPQAAIIKAFLTRNLKQGEINMSLNTENKSPAYLLGRLFAVLEKTQEESSGGVNAGVGDKFYSSASATPKIVFPTLLDLFRKHLKKLEGDNKGRAVYFEKLVTDILDSIDSVQGFPANLSLEDRGVFALGYYQQFRVFYTPKDSSLQ